MTRFPILAALAVLLLTTPARADRVYVYAFDFDFSTQLPGEPIADPIIQVGDVVTWVALDENHSTVACVGLAEFWESPILMAEDTFDWVFTVPGVYNYYCGPHGFDNGDGTATGMIGTITVIPGPTGLAVLGLTGLAASAGRSRRLQPGRRATTTRRCAALS